MKRLLLAVMALMLASSLFAGSALAAAAPAGTKKPAVPTPETAPDWQKKWNAVLANAKKEGQLNVYATAMMGAELRTAMAKTFKDQYGIDLNITPFSGSNLVVKVQEEQRAGLNIADVFCAGTTTFLLSMKPANLLGPIESLLILPEVTNPKAWEGGQLFTFDKKDHAMINMLRVINRSVVYNTDLVKPDEFDSYRDFLKPQFKGKLTMPDPTQSGPGGWFANHLCDIFGFEEGMRLLKDLILKQEMVIQRDGRLHMETVARGKYAVGLGGGTQYIADFLALGAPIAIKVPKEGDGGGTSFGGMAIPVKSPHPNATALFVNWLLTREGQSLFAKYTGNPSRRLDASMEGVNPVFMPLPGEKVAWDTAEFTLQNARVSKAAKEILAQTQK